MKLIEAYLLAAVLAAFHVSNATAAVLSGHEFTPGTSPGRPISYGDLRPWPNHPPSHI
ncbi:hypothetical protein V8E36_001920 [Tilletia maclaganii]